MFCTALSFHVCINIPLLLLASYFDAPLLLALASVGASLGTCALAAAQANLPRNKKRFWSRPLVAALFFLQPIVRGWARFKWRLNLLSAPKNNSVERFPSVPAWELPDVTVYWSDGRIDRHQFLSGIISKLDLGGWSFMTDTGWTTRDVDIPAHVWTRLVLTTVSEELEQGRKNIHCRIASFWSLSAKILFGISAATVLILITAFASVMPWIWMSMIALPLVYWLIDEERLECIQVLVAMVDAVATDQKLSKLAPDQSR
jgi:hypothetical protein